MEHPITMEMQSGKWLFPSNRKNRQFQNESQKRLSTNRKYRGRSPMRRRETFHGKSSMKKGTSTRSAVVQGKTAIIEISSTNWPVTIRRVIAMYPIHGMHSELSVHVMQDHVSSDRLSLVHSYYVPNFRCTALVCRKHIPKIRHLVFTTFSSYIAAFNHYS